MLFQHCFTSIKYYLICIAVIDNGGKVIIWQYEDLGIML